MATPRTPRAKPRLLPAHRKQLEASGISREVRDERGYRSIERHDPRVKTLGFSESQVRLLPALLIPIWDVFGENGQYQLRPDKPRPDLQSGRPRKYENLPGVGVTLDINPLRLDDVLDTGLDLFITEGVKKGDALASHGLPAIALYSVWNWRGTDESGAVTALADWEQIPLKGRRVYVVFDSDVMHKRSVKMALERIGRFLERRSAEVGYIYLPDKEDGAKQGVDDFLAAGHDSEDLMDLVDENVRGLPEIVLNARQLRDVTADAIRALHVANDPPQLFRWANNLARIKVDEDERPIIQAHVVATMRNQLSAVADFYRVSSRGIRADVYAPKELADDILASTEWPFPGLQGITRIPVLRPDGTMLFHPGYDPDTKMAYIPAADLDVPHVPDGPTQEQAAQGRRWLIDELLHDFPFDSEASLANMLACLLTPVLRPAISGRVPLALVDAPQAGTGKSLLGEVQSAIVLGRSAEMRGAPTDENEWRKRITSALMEGPSMTIFDNVMGKLASGELSRALTAQTWTDRVLGLSKDAVLPVRTTWMATGNNIILGGDLPRRAYLIRIDANMARPWTRKTTQFRHPELLGWIGEHRGRILAAMLGMARAWYAAGCPQAGLPVLGSFEEWCSIVGGVLAYAGEEHFLGNAKHLYDEMDTESEQWAPFLKTLHDRFGKQAVSATDVYNVFYGDPVLQDGLPDELADAIAKSVSSFSRVFGNQMRYRKSRHFRLGDHEYFIDRDFDRKAKTWRWYVVRR